MRAQSAQAAEAVIAFDGHCNLCHGAVRFVARRDRHARFAFLPMQSDAGRALCEQLGMDADDPDSFALIDTGTVQTYSGAWMAILRQLGPGWRLLATLAACVPSRLRDLGYRFVARRRYRWFGRSTSCRMPDATAGARLADEDTLAKALRASGTPASNK